MSLKVGARTFLILEACERGEKEAAGDKGMKVKVSFEIMRQKIDLDRYSAEDIIENSRESLN